MAYNEDDKETNAILKLRKLIKEAPMYGTVSIQIVFYNGEIDRFVITREESLKANYEL